MTAQNGRGIKGAIVCSQIHDDDGDFRAMCIDGYKGYKGYKGHIRTAAKWRAVRRCLFSLASREIFPSLARESSRWKIPSWHSSTAQ